MPNKQTLQATGMHIENLEILSIKTLGKAHTDYQNCLFDDSFTRNRRQFWKYIRSRPKEKCGIPSLSTIQQFKGKS